MTPELQDLGRPTRGAYLPTAVADFVQRLVTYGVLEDHERSKAAADLLGVFRNADEDGYEAAKELEYKGWVITADLVSWLDSFSTYDAQEAAEAAWAKQADLSAYKPKLGGLYRAKIGGRPFEGYATSVSTDTAHVTLSENPDAKGGYVIAWERLKALEAGV